MITSSRALALLACVAMLNGCLGKAATIEREVVQFRLNTDLRHDSTLPPESSVVVLEFGSLVCHFCREFHDSVLPGIVSGASSRSGVAFEYVNIDSVSPLVEVAAMVRCISADVGTVAALDSGFRVAATLQQEAIATQVVPAFPLHPDCVPQFEVAEQDAVRAASFGVAATPTLLIGVRRGAIVRGWIVEGMRTELILSTVDSVSERLRQTRQTGE